MRTLPHRRRLVPVGIESPASDVVQWRVMNRPGADDAHRAADDSCVICEAERLSAASSRRIRQALLFVMLIASIACRSTRTVKLAWDVPERLPDGYRVLVDDRMVLDIPPPQVDSGCSCLSVEVAVPRGRHTVSVVAYDRTAGPSEPSARVIVE